MRDAILKELERRIAQLNDVAKSRRDKELMDNPSIGVAIEEIYRLIGWLESQPVTPPSELVKEARDYVENGRGMVYTAARAGSEVAKSHLLTRLADALEASEARAAEWERIAKVQDEKAHHWLERMTPLEARAAKYRTALESVQHDPCECENGTCAACTARAALEEKT